MYNKQIIIPFFSINKKSNNPIEKYSNNSQINNYKQITKDIQLYYS